MSFIQQYTKPISILLIVVIVTLLVYYYNKPIEKLEDLAGNIIKMVKAPLDGVIVKQPNIKIASPSPSDILPKYDSSSEFAKNNPITSLLHEQNFIIGGMGTGISTIVQSQKIPYHDIRPLPPIAKQVISPWNQSSYEKPPGSDRKKIGW